MRSNLRATVFALLLAFSANGDADDESEDGEELSENGDSDGLLADDADQPPQMTQEWWDLHYDTIFREHDIKGDPREPGNPEQKEMFGNDLNDREHFEVALAYAEGVLSQGTADQEVLVLGCGLSPLVFALADRGLGRMHCLEVSVRLVEWLREAATRVPRPPVSFEVGDITLPPCVAKRDHVEVRVDESSRTYVLHHGAGNETHNADNGQSQNVSDCGAGPFGQEKFDIIIDENVLDGMGCTFPAEAGQNEQRKAVAGIQRLLRPGGRLLTLSFLPLDEPPHEGLLVDWPRYQLDAVNKRVVHDDRAVSSALSRTPEQPLLYAGLWGGPPAISLRSPAQSNF